MTDRGKVIVLPTGYDPEGDEAVVTKHREELGPCEHREVAIDEDRAKLLCRRCDTEVEPLEWVKRLARDWQWYRTRVAMANQRAKDAEDSAQRRVEQAQRSARMNTKMPMALGRRLGRIARTIGRAQGDLADAFVALAEIHDTGQSGLADHYLGAAAAQITRARSSLEKLHRDHAQKASA